MFCIRKAGWITALLFILLVSEQVLCAPDYYKILGVSRNAKEDEIKKQYKKKSKIFHPDRNPGDKKEWAQKKFSELTDAYQTLKDPQKRDLYDRGGEEAVKDFEQGKQNPGSGGGFGGFGGGGVNLEDILGGFFGGGGFSFNSGGGGGGRGKRAREQSYGSDYTEDEFDDGRYGQKRKQKISFKDSEVVMISPENYFELENRKRLYLVVFFKAKALETSEIEAIKELATKYKGIMNVGAVDCDQYLSLCQQAKVKSVPLVRVYFEDRSKQPDNLNSQITFESLKQETIKRLENYIKPVNLRNFETYKSEALRDKKNVFILFTLQKKASPLFMTLSTMFKSQIILLQNDVADIAFASEIGIIDVPAFIWVKNFEKNEFELYEGKTEKISLSMWIGDRANRKVKTAEKKVEELTAPMLKSGTCDRQEKNFCVVGVFSDQQQRKSIESLWKMVMKKYQDDPVKFYLIDSRVFRAGCVTSEESNMFIFRTKRSKYEPIPRGMSPENLNSKIDNLLGGAALENSMKKDLASCLV